MSAVSFLSPPDLKGILLLHHYLPLLLLLLSPPIHTLRGRGRDVTKNAKRGERKRNGHTFRQWFFHWESRQQRALFERRDEYFFGPNWILYYASSNPLLLPSVVVLFTSFPPSSSSSFSQADHWRRMRGEFRLLWMEEREKNPTTTHDSPNRQKGGKKCRLLPPFLYLLFREFLRWILRNITDNQGNCVFRECYSS